MLDKDSPALKVGQETIQPTKLDKGRLVLKVG